MSLGWCGALSADEVAGVRALLEAVAEADGVAAVSEAFRLRLSGRGAEHLLVVEDATLVGYAQLAGGEAELCVHPGHRRRGIGGRLAADLVERAPDGLRVWAHGEHPGAAALAERMGFVPVRTLLKLRLRFDHATPEPAFAPGMTVRTFVPGQDEAAVVGVNARAFDWHPEQGRWTVDDVLARESEPWFDADGFLVAQDKGKIVGFHWTKVHDADTGEVYVLAVDPDAHGRGLGTALTLAGLHHLRKRGVGTVILYVEADNRPALRTYDRLGFTRWDADVCYAAR